MYDKNIATQKNIVTTYTGFYSVTLMKHLEDKYDFIIINPETIPYDELILYLTFASKIIVSWGAILYGNGIFFNKTAKRYLIIRSDCNCEAYYDNDFYKNLYFNKNLDDNIENFIKSVDE
jgi:hypothetical protein